MNDNLDETFVTILDINAHIMGRIRETSSKNQALVRLLDRSQAGPGSAHDGVLRDHIGSNAEHLQAWVQMSQLFQELPIRQPKVIVEDTPF